MVSVFQPFQKSLVSFDPWQYMICLLLCLIFHSRVYILSWNMIGVRNLLLHSFIIMTTRLFCLRLLKKHMHFNNVINIINLRHQINMQYTTIVAIHLTSLVFIGEVFPKNEIEIKISKLKWFWRYLIVRSEKIIFKIINI